MMMNKWWHLRQVSGEELGHAEGADTIVAENLGHLLVRGEVLPVFGILKVVWLLVGPQFSNAFLRAGLVHSNDISEVGTELHGSVKTGFFRWCFGTFGKFGTFRLFCWCFGASSDSALNSQQELGDIFFRRKSDDMNTGHSFLIVRRDPVSSNCWDANC